MDLIDLLEKYDIVPKRKASTNGGEYCSPCPVCEGKDRFIIWPKKDRYWCRQCNARGNSIQFCCDYFEMSFAEACRYLKIVKPAFNYSRVKRENHRLSTSREPSEKWQIQAVKYVRWSHEYLLSHSDLLSTIMNERELTYQIVCEFKLGYSYNKFGDFNNDFFREREGWGLPSKCNEQGKPSKLWLPSGLVIPYYDNNRNLLKIKTRRKDWYPEDKFPKYVEITGSGNRLFICGDVVCLPTLLVEAELDAIKVYQEAANICACVATGGASKKPDAETHSKLLKTPLLLFALDDDEAGCKAYKFWRKIYRNLHPWPAPFAKSPADACKAGANILNWVRQGIQRYTNE